MYILAAGPGPFDLDLDNNSNRHDSNSHTNNNSSSFDSSSSQPTSIFNRAAQQIAAFADNPPRRDVQNVEPGGHIVVQMDVENPGIWPFHCHIVWHASAGFFSQLLFLPDDIMALQPDAAVEQACAEWREFTAGEVVEQIDSGL